MTGKADQNDIAGMSFEEALKALEGVVAALEGGEVPLEQSIDLYERGEALRKHCEKRLKDAEMRVEKIVRGADGDPAAEPLDATAQRPGTAGEDIPF